MTRKTREGRIREVLERFEEEYNFPNSVFVHEGLTVANGFQKKFLNTDVVSAHGAELLKNVEKFLDHVMAIPHFADILRQYFETIPRRKVRLKSVTIEIEVENYYRSAMERHDIILSPSDKLADTFLLLILDVQSNRMIKFDLDREKRQLEAIYEDGCVE